MVKFKNTVTTILAELINWALNPYKNGLASSVKKIGLSALNVSQLKEKCRAARLPVGGTKEVLIKRLRGAAEVCGVDPAPLENEGYNVGMLRNIAKKTEREWGNKMINQNNNNNWTTSLGENLVRDVLRLLGKNPRKPDKKDGYRPDWECDDEIYEVKTSNWTVDGTAGEKVLGVHYKYSDVPIIYGKPLYIVCVAYQEYELTNGNTRIFGEDISERKREILEMVKKWDIHYIKFSDLVKPLII
jgi:hypothetical protein